MAGILHRLGWCGCTRGDTWHIDGRCVPLVTAAYEREQRALAEHRAQQEQRRTFRRGLVIAAGRGHIAAGCGE